LKKRERMSVEEKKYIHMKHMKRRKEKEKKKKNI